MADIVTKETTVSTEPLEEGITPERSEEKVEGSKSVEYVIFFILGLIEILLTFRLIFKITGANPVSGFVSFIYALTQIFILPFIGIFRPATTQGVETTAIFEPATLVAMVVYAVLAWGAVQLLVILSRRPKE